MKKCSFILTISICAVICADAQPRDKNRPRSLVSDNFGLTAPQEPASLPVSAVPVLWPERKDKTIATARLEEVGQDAWLLTGGWELAPADEIVRNPGSIFDAEYDTGGWFDATVPGTVLTTLVEQGVYPDPYYGVNNMVIPDTLCRTDWWYRVAFDAPPRSEGRAWLCFDGINYRADVWLNGTRLGDIKGAFIRGRFDVTEVLRDKNVLAVHIYPPNNPGIPHEQSATALRGPNGGQLAMDGPTFISSEGWDWIPGIRDRNIGIWQDVRLEYTGDVTLGDFAVVTDLPLPDLSYAEITVKGAVTNHSSRDRIVEVAGRIEKVVFSRQVTIPAGETAEVAFSPVEFPQLRIDNPRLWWPNGYGAQELYTLGLSVGGAGRAETRKNIRFGIRELDFELTVDMPGAEGQRVLFNPLTTLSKGAVIDCRYQRKVGGGVVVPTILPSADPALLKSIEEDGMGPYLVVRVNGVRIFCKGGNWGMDDGMKRVSRERLEPYLRLHRDANYNMIRNWTGESTEEVFYELCDEYGMLVWNDFWMSTEGYNLNPLDEDLFMANATDVVRRFRNHPSIAIWCPRNEGYAPPSLETRINEMTAREDGTRLYHGNSRYLNLMPSGGWYYVTDQSHLYSEQARGFNTELGTPSLPTLETLRSFIPEEDLWPVGSDLWHFHDWHFGQETYHAAIDSLWGPVDNIEDFVRKAQMVNYDSHRAMFEAWNSRMWNNTSGVLLWMTHPAWPSVTWQTYSWDYETYGSHFGAMKGCEPLHIQMNLDDLSVVAVNASTESYTGMKASLVWYDLRGKGVKKQETTLGTVAANSLTACFAADEPSSRGLYIARLTLSDKRGRTVSVNDYLRPVGLEDMRPANELAEAALTGKVRKVTKSSGGNKVVEFELTNPSKIPVLAVKMNVRNSDGERVLPAFFSDGYFNLLPGEKRAVTVEYPVTEGAWLSAEAFNMKTGRIAEIK